MQQRLLLKVTTNSEISLHFCLDLTFEIWSTTFNVQKLVNLQVFWSKNAIYKRMSLRYLYTYGLSNTSCNLIFQVTNKYKVYRLSNRVDEKGNLLRSLMYFTPCYFHVGVKCYANFMLIGVKCYANISAKLLISVVHLW